MTTSHTCPHCGGIFEDAKAHKRSTPQHRRFMAICRAAYFSWPDTHEFRPISEQHLRYYLEMRAGNFSITKQARIESTDPHKLYALMSAFMRHSEDHTLFVELDGNLLIQKKVGSVSYEAMGPTEFGRLKDAVCEIIEAEIGIAAEKLLSETERAA